MDDARLSPWYSVAIEAPALELRRCRRARDLANSIIDPQQSGKSIIAKANPSVPGGGGGRDVCKLQRHCVGCRVCRQYHAWARESSSSQGDKLAEL